MVEKPQPSNPITYIKGYLSTGSSLGDLAIYGYVRKNVIRSIWAELPRAYIWEAIDVTEVRLEINES